MADESNQTTQEAQGEKITFSDAQQEKINAIISERLAERDAKHAQEMDSLEKRHKRDLEMSKLDDESRHKAEMEEQNKALRERAETAEHALRVAEAKRRLAEADLDSSLAETVMGADDDAMAKNIDALVKASKALADRMYAERVGSAGAPRAPDGTAGPSDLKHIRELMGLK